LSFGVIETAAAGLLSFYVIEIAAADSLSFIVIQPLINTRFLRSHFVTLKETACKEVLSLEAVFELTGGAAALE
jgi:hypothetical protein